MDSEGPHIFHARSEAQVGGCSVYRVFEIDAVTCSRLKQRWCPPEGGGAVHLVGICAHVPHAPVVILRLWP